MGVIGEEKVDENLNRPERIDVIRRLKVQNNQNGASANNLNIRANIYGKGFERLPDKTNCVGSLHDAIYRPQSTSVDDLVPSYPVEKKKDVPNTSQAIVSYTKTYTKKITDRQVDNSYELMIPCMVNESDASESGIKAKVRNWGLFTKFRDLKIQVVLILYLLLGLLMLVGTLTHILFSL